uniref:Uncharacterized protein n=1 Tax=Rhizophora mucronata TaxID=61149 RepID=A0A2P2PCW4_RHIMU
MALIKIPEDENFHHIQLYFDRMIYWKNPSKFPYSQPKPSSTLLFPIYQLSELPQSKFLG